MNDEQRERLQTWYREALARRAAALESLVTRIAGGDPDAIAEARRAGRSLAGSGGTYGFGEVSEAAGALAGAAEGVLPRVLGLLDVLRSVAGGVRPHGDRAGRWLVYAAGPLPDPPEGGAVPPDLDLEEAWSRVAARLGMDGSALARRIASRLGVEVADPAAAERTAGLVVPPALALEHRVLPLREDGSSITAASANPTDVLAMAALERGTGRVARLEVSAPGPLAATLAERYGTGGTDGPPGHRAPADPLHRGSAPGGPAREVTILVVDDDASDRLLCRTALEREGFAVLEAEEGTAALEVLASGRRVDALIVDVLMPGMDGPELLERLRRHPAHARRPVVLLTGLRSRDREARLIEGGADDYLRKPVEPRLLVARVRACLRRSGVAGTP